MDILEGDEEYGSDDFQRYGVQQAKEADTKRKFLQEKNEIIPWADWVRKIEPYYPKGKRGRPPRGIEVMLRMYLLQI